ncbi:MAG: hypothetical protein WC551_00890 [Patescibacteria group bacterium]
MAVEIQDFSRSSMSPHWHYRLEDGKMVFRLWDDSYYHEGENTREQVMEFNMFQALRGACELGLYSIDQYFRNLTKTHWWTKRSRPKGKVERHVDEELLDRTVIRGQAEKMALVALSAIRAYRAYVEGGGDPSRLPAMTFEGGEFKVAMKDQKDI